MDRRRLASFLILAEELHFSRAAARCHISQSGLSQQLAQLEAELQIRLVDRTRRHVALTRAGEVYAAEARKVVRSMDEAASLARRAGSGMAGPLVVAATSPALFMLLPEIVTALADAAPDVEVAVRPMTTAEQETALRRGEIDVGIVHPPLDDPDLACRTIATLPFDVVLSDRNPLARAPTLRLRDLARERFILFPRQVGPQLHDQILALCLQEGFSPREIQEATPAQSIVGLAACNLGVGFIASRLQHYDRPGVVYRRLEGPAPAFTLGVAHRPDHGPASLRTFVELAVRVGAAAT